MAKKGQVQLQAEINNDEEWQALLEKSGLIVVDIYSDWCGPCMGMAANLKKLKLEIGGDLLQLAVAKSDTISSLARFRNKSEPTWMFISKGKMVNLMFGADAPKLTRLIINELKREKSELPRDRPILEITELAEEEQVRYEEAEAIAKAAVEKEEAKKRKEIYDRRTAECSNIVENLKSYGVVLVFPHAKDVYKDVLQEVVGEAGLTIQQIERIKSLTESSIEELLYFTNFSFPKQTILELTTKQSIALLLKRCSDTLPPITNDIVLQMVYGNMREHPGDEKSPSQLLMKPPSDPEDYEATLIGVWAPPNSMAKGMALKILFPNLSTPFKLPETKLIPPHVAVAYDAFKSPEVMELNDKYPGQILAYGFFTSDIPAEAKLIAKTVDKFENKEISTTYEEKIIVQLAKTDMDCIFAFTELGPTYISPDAVIGEKECRLLFPDGYNEPEQEIVEVKKKNKKKNKKHVAMNEQVGETKEESEISNEAIVENDLEDDTLIADEENEEQDEDDDTEEGKEEATLIGADKATSPIGNDIKSE